MPPGAYLLPQPHILIVDDSAEDMRLLADALRGAGYRFSLAFDGPQGHDRAVAALPDLILLDVQMPHMDGIAVARMLKANPLTAAIPILFLSVLNDINTRLTVLRECGVDYITKPFLVEEVVERVRIHLGFSADLSARHAANLDDVPYIGAGAHMEGPRHILVRAVKRYLSERLDEPLRLSDLASLFAVSERKLSKAFHQCLGMTVFEFIRNERMRKAQRLLLQTSMGIVTIAEETGFSSAANFATAFRNHVGLTPSAFRSSSRVDLITDSEGAMEWRSHD